MTVAEADELRRSDPEEYLRRSRAAIAAHCAAMVGFLDAGAEVFDYGNSLRAEAKLGGFERAFAYPGFVPAYIRPLFCEGKGPFRWVALSGDEADIAATDRAVLEELPDDERLARWMKAAGEKMRFQALPARICGVGIGRSIHAGMVCVANGSYLATQKLERVLKADPGTGVMLHADAGYERAVEVANERGVRIPMRE